MNERRRGEEREERREERGERGEISRGEERGSVEGRGENSYLMVRDLSVPNWRQIVNRMEKITYKSDIRLGETNGELKGGKRREGG